MRSPDEYHFCSAQKIIQCPRRESAATVMTGMKAETNQQVITLYWAILDIHAVRPASSDFLIHVHYNRVLLFCFELNAFLYRFSSTVFQHA